MNVYCNPQLIVNHGHEFAHTIPFGKQDGRMTSFNSFKTIIMRNYLLSLLVALLAVTGSLPMAAQKAYAVLTPDDGTLTFYYDNQRDTRQNSGGIYDMPRPGVPPAWTYYSNDPEKNIMHVMFDTSFFGYRPTSTSSWFGGCINLQDIKGIRNLNTEHVTDMSYMFYGCEALTSLDVSKFNTQNVTSMSSMFANCQALTSLDVSKFKTQKVTDMSYMFYGCTSLATIFCNSYWEASHKVNDKEMFYNCTQLKGTNTSFDASRTGIEMANPTTGYFTSKTTGIDHVKTADRAGYGKAYDPSGRRVNESYKGIIIKNGKKYIQK